MCILSRVSTPVASTPAAPTCPAKSLPPQQRQFLAVAALAGSQSITQLAQDHDVSRKFVYQQAHKAEQALDEAFVPAAAADEPVLFYLPVTKRWLRRLILALLLICHSSYRGVQELLRDLFDYATSLGHIHDIAHAAMDRACTANQRTVLSGVRVGAHDEIFQTRQPVLVGVDVFSTYCYLLSLEEHRDGETWGIRLLELQDRGFAPQAIICDGGSGLQAGQELALPQTPRRGDVFHAFHETETLVTCLENRAYEAIAARSKLERKQAEIERKKGRRDRSVAGKLVQARLAEARALGLAADVATLTQWLRQDILAVAGPRYAARCALYDFVVAQLQARAAQGPRRLSEVCTYLVNHREVLLAFAKQLDADLDGLATEFQLPEAVVRAVLHLQALDPCNPRRWPPEAALRQQLRGRFYELSEAVAALAQRTVRASSVVENLNSRLRNYFFLRRHLGPDYLQLLQFFLNHRRFLRSEHPERVDHSPAELLTGAVHPHWLDLLTDAPASRN
jgi:hypothetical protein